MLLAFATASIHVQAQDGATPSPNTSDGVVTDREAYKEFYLSPAQSTGNAEWVIRNHSFASNYPDGMIFSISAESSGGPIESATVFWSHVPGQQLRYSATWDEAEEFFVANWQKDRSVPPWVAVNYHWRLTDSAGNTYRTIWFTGAEYEDRTRPWLRQENDDGIVFLQAGLDADVADETLRALTQQREFFRSAWGDILSYKPRVILFNDRDTFNEWRLTPPLTTGAIIVGQTFDNFGATVQFVYNSDLEQLAWGTVPHEIAHLYQAEFYPKGGFIGATGWWGEGQATFFEVIPFYDYISRVRRLARNGQLEALMLGEGPNPSGLGPDGSPRMGYDIGYTFFVWLTDNYGIEGHRQVIDLIRAGHSRDEALEMLTGMNIQTIERTWRQWLGAQGDAPTLIPTPTIEMRFPPTVTPFGN